jgi:hypothetical protein
MYTRCPVANACRGVRRKKTGITSQYCTGVREERTWSREAEKPPLLEAVARERLVKKEQAGKGLSDAVVICELWRLDVAL